MKTVRQIAVFQIQAVLLCCVAVFVVAECACILVGELCQLVEGPQ